MAKKENKDNNKQKSRFFKDMKAELKKVIWPTAKQTANNTIAVIAFTLAIALIVFVLDVVFDFANKNGVVALQEKVKSSYSANNTTEGSTDENSTSESSTDENATTDENSESKDSNNSENSEGSTEENATNVEAEVETENSAESKGNE